MLYDKNTLLAEADTSRKRHLMLVGRHTDHDVDLCGEHNVDGKRQCLGKGQTKLTKPPTQVEFEESWSEDIIKNVLTTFRLSFQEKFPCPCKRLIDPYEWRRTQIVIHCCDGMKEGILVLLYILLLELDRYYFKSVKGLDEGIRTKLHQVFMTKWSVFHDPIHSVDSVVDRQFCRWDMDDGVKKDMTGSRRISGQ